MIISLWGLHKSLYPSLIYTEDSKWNMQDYLTYNPKYQPIEPGYPRGLVSFNSLKSPIKKKTLTSTQYKPCFSVAIHLNTSPLVAVCPAVDLVVVHQEM